MGQICILKCIKRGNKQRKLNLGCKTLRMKQVRTIGELRRTFWGRLLGQSSLSFKTVDDTKDLIIITNEGIIIRLAVDKISEMSRVTQGVRLMNLREGQKVATVSVVDKVIEEEIAKLEKAWEVEKDAIEGAYKALKAVDEAAAKEYLTQYTCAQAQKSWDWAHYMISKLGEARIMDNCKVWNDENEFGE